MVAEESVAKGCFDSSDISDFGGSFSDELFLNLAL